MGRGKAKRRLSRRRLRAHELGISDRHNRSAAQRAKFIRLNDERLRAKGAIQ